MEHAWEMLSAYDKNASYIGIGPNSSSEALLPRKLGIACTAVSGWTAAVWLSHTCPAQPVGHAIEIRRHLQGRCSQRPIRDLLPSDCAPCCGATASYARAIKPGAGTPGLQQRGSRPERPQAPAFMEVACARMFQLYMLRL